MSEFYEGAVVRIIGNCNAHCYETDEIVTLTVRHIDYNFNTCWSTGRDCGNIAEKDMVIVDKSYFEPKGFAKWVKELENV